MFSKYEKKDIISQFPNDIELCYEKRFHNKVHSIEYYITIQKEENILHGLKHTINKIFYFY